MLLLYRTSYVFKSKIYSLFVFADDITLSSTDTKADVDCMERPILTLALPVEQSPTLIEPQCVTNIDEAEQGAQDSSPVVAVQHISILEKPTQTPASLSSTTPRKSQLRKNLHYAQAAVKRKHKTVMRLRRKVALLKNQRVRNSLSSKRIADIVRSAKKFISGDGLKLFELQLRQASKHPRGQRYTDDEKLLALSLYSHGPKAYRFLSSILTLPTKASLSLWLQSIQE